VHQVSNQYIVSAILVHILLPDALSFFVFGKVLAIRWDPTFRRLAHL